MDFIQVIQANFMSGLLYWLVFGISIFMATLYQNIRIKYLKDRTIQIRSMSKSVQNIWFFIIIIAPTLIIGFRDYHVGADTMNTVNNFLKISQVISFEETYSDIIGAGFIYALIRYLVYFISDGNTTFYLLILAFLTLYLLVQALNSWLGKVSLPFALFLYYAFIGMQLLNQSRQMLALSVVVMALLPLINKKYKRYYILIFIASLIHYTAFIGALFPLLYFRKNYYYPIKQWFYYSMIILSPLLLIPIFSIVKYIIPSSYESYLTELNYEGIGFGLVLNLTPIIIPVILFKRYLKGSKNDLLYRINLLSFPFRLSGYYSYFVMRMYYYGAISVIILIPIIIKNIENKIKQRRIYIGVIGLFLLYYLINYMYLDPAGMFPYESIL